MISKDIVKVKLLEIWISVAFIIIFISLISCAGKQQTNVMVPTDSSITTSGNITLGVMNFDNNSLGMEHDSLDRLKTGIPHALMTELSKVEKLTVVDRTKPGELLSGKPLAAQLLCFGIFMDKPGETDEIIIHASISMVETGKGVKIKEVTGSKQNLSKLIKLLALRIANQLKTSFGVTVNKIDRKKIKTNDTSFSATSMVIFEEAREFESQRMFEQAELKYEETLKISSKYFEAKQALERLKLIRK